MVYRTPRCLLGILLMPIALIVMACGGGSTSAPAQTAPTTAPPKAAPTAAAQPTTAAAAAAPQATAGGAAAQPAGGKPQKFVYVSPSPLGVNAFLILGRKGIEDAAKKYGATSRTIESEDPVTREQNVRAAVNDGATLVMVVGFEFADILPKVAAEAPNTQFLIVDQCIDKPPANIHCALFREYEAGYLLGAEAGLLTKSNKVGVISAIDIPFLHRYTDSFAQGAKAVNPNVEVSTLWIGTDEHAFSDPARAKEQALAMSAKGADQIFAAGAASNLGIFEAAKEKAFFSYGVDVNQCPQAPGHIVDNLLKRVDVAVVKGVDAIMSGSKDQVLVFGLKEGGVGVVPFVEDKPDASQCEIMKHPDVIAKIKDLQSKIASGELKLQDPMFAK